MKRKRITGKIENLRKGIYILPNLFTSFGLFFGFFSIIHSIKGDFEKSATGIFLAGVFDGLDGNIARFTKSNSRFGVQYDSLSDLVSFGIAPALLAYLWILQPYGRWGWLGAFLYVACAALRLARFNLQYNTEEKNVFTGLPTPGGAFLIASTLMIFRDLQIEPPLFFHFLFVIFIYLISLLMVSNIRFLSLKDFGLFKRKPFISLFFLIAVIMIIAAEPWKFLFGLSYAYLFTGLGLAVFKFFSKKRKVEIFSRKEGLTDDRKSFHI